MKVEYRFRKIRNQVKGFVSPIFRKNVLSKDICNTKLIMTLLVKNEGDIIRDNIDFHLRNGVDFIIATDNNSDDDTLKILQDYEKQGVLHLIREPTKGYYQEKWVNRMGEIAYTKYKADFIFHCDADEFWKPQKGNLKEELLAHPTVDLLKVNAKNIILEDKGGEERYPGDAIYAVINPLKKNKHKNPDDPHNIYLDRPHRKVMFRTSNGLVRVRQGNHRIHDEKYEVVQKKASDITIYHFPSRGKSHFYKKTVDGGSAYEQASDLNQNMGGHWRKWYDAHKSGKLDREYKLMVLTEKEADRLIKKKVVEKNTFFPQA